MEVKRDILWRVYICFIAISVFGLVIIGRAIYIQHVEGEFWLAQADQQQQREVELEAVRGTIYSEDGSMLSTSIPFFDIYIDFGAEGLREKEGKNFRENLDSLSINLAAVFKDRSSRQYKQLLQDGYKKKHRYFLLKRSISFYEYKQLRQFPLVRLGKNKSGFIAELRNKRLNPFGLLANRTIGLSRDYIDSSGRRRNNNVGLEKTYDDMLKGESGKKLVRYLAGGVYAPVEGSEIEPQQGKDIISTLDVNIQDITETALLKMMQENEAVHGTAIVMEVKTGKIKAIANLGLKPDGQYWENLNYAIQSAEPGSTFKLATVLALLEDGYIDLNDQVDLEKGSWRVGRRTVFDSERHGRNQVTVKQAFEYSSNVGMAKLVLEHYGTDPKKFIGHLKRLNLHEPTGIDLIGESSPVIKTPKSKTWSATTLPWMSFGYEVLLSPLQTLTLYNAVANNGTMMKPYLVNRVQEAGITVQEFEPVEQQKICSDKTLLKLRQMLEGVCSIQGGTAFNLFKDAPYTAAGKTGTALVADGKNGYSNRIYQSSFAGYFPADNPRYSCIVVIRNKPFAKKYYGGVVAGPVFREIADKLYALHAGTEDMLENERLQKDSAMFLYAGSSEEMKMVLSTLQSNYRDSAEEGNWALMYPVNYMPVLKSTAFDENRVPDLRGMGLKDALYLLENMRIEVSVRGKGRVITQSVPPGSLANNIRRITLELK